MQPDPASPHSKNASAVNKQPDNNSGSGAPAKRRWPIWLAAVLVLLSGGYLLSQRTGSQRPGGASPEQPSGKSKSGKGGGGAIPVSVDHVRKGDQGVYINALGTVTPVYTVTITSRIAGQLMDVHYQEGQIVHKGDLLAVIDPRPYLAAYTQAQGQLQRDQALLHNARIDLDRYKSAFEQHAIPEQTLATQQSTVNQFEGVTKLDEGNVEAAKVNVDYSRITAPIDGRVGLRAVDPGNIIQANGTVPLLTITQLQPITVIFTMAEDYIYDVTSQMRSGHTLRVDAFDRDSQTKLAQGTVLTLDNQIDTATGTVKVRASFANRDNRLFPNEFVNARLLVKTLMGVNLIPTAAIQRNNDISYVYVVNTEKNTVLARNITVANTDGLAAAVTGVAPGETVVIDGFDKLQDNTKISVRDASGGGGKSRATGPGTAGSNSNPSGSNPAGATH